MPTWHLKADAIIISKFLVYDIKKKYLLIFFTLIFLQWHKQISIQVVPFQIPDGSNS